MEQQLHRDVFGRRVQPAYLRRDDAGEEADHAGEEVRRPSHGTYR